MFWRIGLLLGLCLGGSAACSSGPEGTCFEDSDCPGAQACLFDLDREATYCTDVGCAVDTDCPRFQSCSAGGVCINLIRDCSGTEVLNGLDDNCDGVVDEAGSELITGCVSNQTCGAFVCGGPAGQPDTVCTPRNEAGTGFGACTRDDQCSNGICVTGFCSPICGSIGALCPTISLPNSSTVREGWCVRAVGAGSDDRPRFNQCQPECSSQTQCPAPYICAWRDVASTLARFDPDHQFVCSLPDPNRKALGASCAANSRAGDDECTFGLCLGPTSGPIDPRCTRSCGGPASDCSDVGPDYTCVERDLTYGGISEMFFVCSRGGP